ncbi:MAG: hydroxymethylglutaryl-CoA lyase [Desulfobacterales bacterium]|jgi:hydroxymethylglutaryl-CoA lyase|nr:hydroxymethylglutaryl-CoA lyase [Desulfobacterales bacterium]
MSASVDQNRFPPRVTLLEVGPRDGFQFEQAVIPTELKLEMIHGLIAAGLKNIQVTSFVNPRKVPQMADAEELVRRLPKGAGVCFSGLVLNRIGLERASRSGLGAVEISVSASDSHSRRNTGMPLAVAVAQGQELVRMAVREGLQVRASVQCAFGCVQEGLVPEERVQDILAAFKASGAHSLALADTTGMATPTTVKRLLRRVLPTTGSVPLALHLHDTRGLGLVNLMAGLECGLTQFDTAFGGLGGCPFVEGAAGNIATEDTLYLLAALGVATGVDGAAVASCSCRLATFLGKTFAGKLYRLAF